MKKKCLVLPGRIFSKNDGDDHFIGAKQLMKLYRVNPRECVVGELHPDGLWSERPPGVRDDLIELAPRYSGDYNLKKT